MLFQNNIFLRATYLVVSDDSFHCPFSFAATKVIIDYQAYELSRNVALVFTANHRQSAHENDIYSPIDK